MELHLDVLLHLLHAADGVEEVHVPGRPAVLAVGHRQQAHLLLHAHGLHHRRVLHGAQARGVQAPRGEVLAGFVQLGRAQQAAHVIGAERPPQRRRGVRAEGVSEFGEGAHRKSPVTRGIST